MRSLPFAVYAFASALLTASFASASSTIRNPISTISAVQNATIHTYSQRVTALSDFHLSFVLQQDLHVKFHLEPNHDILSEDTIITHLAPDGSVERRETIDRLQHKVFKGTAWIQRAGRDGKWRQAGWARVSVLQDGKDPVFEGSFSLDFDNHHLMTVKNYEQTRHVSDPVVDKTVLGSASVDQRMIVWRDSDILEDHQLTLPHTDLKRSLKLEERVCRSDHLDFNTNPDHPVYVGMRKRSYGAMDFSHLFGKRQNDITTTGNGAGVNLVSTIGQTQGCPSTRKVALVGVAVDCNYRSDFASEQAARENVISQMNQASDIWERTFNISLGLANIVVMNAQCPGSPQQSTLWNQACTIAGTDIQTRLNQFSGWRGTQSDSYSHWTLLSTCATDSAVGLAWLGQACIQQAVNTTASTGNGGRTGSDTVSGANVVVRTQGASEWQIIAHETGHTYGAVHDCTNEACRDQNYVNSQQCCQLNANSCSANGGFIMNPSTRSGVRDFSPCSIGNICSAIGRNSVRSTCLSNNKQVTTISGQQCGNGIVEPGEDCDCGGETGCRGNRCCNPTTCKFTTGSVCDDSNEDCCRNCQLASASTVCRASTGECDPAETCSGSSPYCPEDTTTADGSSCGNGLQCASGHCTSRDQQCKTVMGSYTQGNDTYACDSSSCVITCASPEFGPGTCYGLQQNFLDGTTCAGGGTCQNGRCQNIDAGKAISSWVNDHKGVVIGVSVGVGVLLLLILIGCIRGCCRRRSRANKTPQPPPVAATGGWQGWNGARQAGPNGQNYQHNQHASHGWFSPNQPNHPPPPPPPVFAGQGTVRYA